MRRLIYCISLSMALVARAAVAEIEGLRCEYLTNPCGIDSMEPRLSWVVTSKRRGERQTAYQILVASSRGFLDRNQGDLWDTGKVPSDETSQVPYAGRTLSSRQECFWKARIWDANGKCSAWSQVNEWQMGLLRREDWNAKWIGGPAPGSFATDRLVIDHATYRDEAGEGTADVTSTLAGYVKENGLMLVVNNQTLGTDPAPNKRKKLHIEYHVKGERRTKEALEDQTLILPEELGCLPYFRKSFEGSGRIQKAVLYATALGLYEVRINGQRVGDHVLAPDWTDYRRRVQYQAYDVTSLLKKGRNAIAAILANGWYCGRIGNGGNQFFGKSPAFLGQLEITYSDGHRETIVTDESWKTHVSPILSSDFMNGEDYDARLELRNWDRADFSDAQWPFAAARLEPSLSLDAQVMEPVREIREIKPRSVNEPQPGHWVFDLGQNMVGVARLRVSAPAGTKITLRHAEMLNPDGTVYTANLRGAPSIDHYICKGVGTEVWQPRFTFHGFRYVEVSGLRERPPIDLIKGVVIASDTRRVGQFACSDRRINQLQSNIQWGQRGNYVSVPTDCPQRDERLGWMGDAQVFIHTAIYNADVAAFFTKWLVDVDDGQSPEGAFSSVSPNTMDSSGVPGWGDAGVICPWTIYETYGDKRILERHVPAMIKWIEYLRSHSEGLIRKKDRGDDYGDWLSINADSSKELIGTAFFAYSTHLLAKSCAVLGRGEEAARYEALFQDIKSAFNKEYVSPEGRIMGNTQTAYALALKFDLLPEEVRPKAARYLKDDIEAKGCHLSTGFLGVGYLLPVLTDSGESETAYQLLLQDTFPSWLFSVKHGATTIWERWDGWTPEKGFQDPGMNSFNHYSLGSCGEYLFGYVGGIRAQSPGFKSILIAPVIRDDLSWARTGYDSIHGRIATSWKRRGNRLTLEVTVPANTTATVCVPAKDSSLVTEDGKALAKMKGVRFVRQEPDTAVFEVGSGNYRFESEM